MSGRAFIKGIFQTSQSEPKRYCSDMKEVRDTRTVYDMRRSGRPKATTGVDDRYLRISARRNPESNTTMLNNAFRAAIGRRVSAQTVRNRLHDAQLHSRRPWQGSHFTPRHHAARYRWPQNTLNGLVRIGIKFCSQVSVVYAFNQTIAGHVFGESLVRLNVLDTLSDECNKTVVP